MSCKRGLSVFIFLVGGENCIAFVISAWISEIGGKKGRQKKSRCEVTEYLGICRS